MLLGEEEHAEKNLPQGSTVRGLGPHDVGSLHQVLGDGVHTPHVLEQVLQVLGHALSLPREQCMCF